MCYRREKKFWMQPKDVHMIFLSWLESEIKNKSEGLRINRKVTFAIKIWVKQWCVLFFKCVLAPQEVNFFLWVQTKDAQIRALQVSQSQIWKTSLWKAKRSEKLKFEISSWVDKWQTQFSKNAWLCHRRQTFSSGCTRKMREAQFFKLVGV